MKFCLSQDVEGVLKLRMHTRLLFSSAGVSYGLNQQLYNFWRKSKFEPLYLRQVRGRKKACVCCIQVLCVAANPLVMLHIKLIMRTAFTVTQRRAPAKPPESTQWSCCVRWSTMRWRAARRGCSPLSRTSRWERCGRC